MLLHHPVHVLKAVEAIAEAEVFGEGLIGVVGGIQQLVDRGQLRRAHDSKV